jgi:hypothetical protein
MYLLRMPLPPRWEEVVGWTDDDEVRWLSAYWSSCGDHPWLSDGRFSMSGRPYGWLAWTKHPRVAPVLAGLNLGGSEGDGPDALLIDRVERRVYGSDRSEARRFVRAQRPACAPIRISQEDIGFVVHRIPRTLLNRPLPSSQQLIASMRRHSGLVAELINYLDAWEPCLEETDERTP